MSDDWRVRVSLRELGHAERLSERLSATELEHDLEHEFKHRIGVSRDGDEVFCYADTREQAERVQQLIQTLAAQHHWELTTELRRWHPTAEQWEDPDRPLPAAGDQAEHAELIASEREEAEVQGYPDFEVRVQCHSHRDAVELAERLRGEGLEVVRRWKYLLIGAEDEDSARELAERLRTEVPAGATVTAEGSGQAVLGQTRGNPFAWLGGLGG